MNYIPDETREERREKVERALSISLSGANLPSENVLDAVENYIDGMISFEELKKLVIDKYRGDDKND